MLGAVFEVSPYERCLCHSSASDLVSYYSGSSDKHDWRRYYEMLSCQRHAASDNCNFHSGRPKRKDGFGRLLRSETCWFVLTSEIMSKAC